MAEIEKLMGVSATDIEKVMGVGSGDIEKVMGVALGRSNAWQGTRALGYGYSHDGTLGGSTTYNHDRIMYKTMASAATTLDFGNISSNAETNYASGFQGGGRCMFAGIYDKSSGSFAVRNTMQYITVANTGNSTDAGDLNTAAITTVGNGGGSNGTTALLAHGWNSSWGVITGMEYFTISSTGDASVGGDKTVARGSNGVGNSTRVWWLAGYDGAYPRSNIIDSGTYASPTSDASDWGDCYQGNQPPLEGSESRIIVFPQYGDGAYAATGSTSFDFSNVYIYYFGTASAGDVSEFGYGHLFTCDQANYSWYPNGQDSAISTDSNQKFAVHEGSVMSDGTRCEQWAGRTYTGTTNASTQNGCGDQGNKDIYYITIASTGNAADAGYDIADLSETFDRTSNGAGCTGT